jgi:acetyl/propionyl-CoA carboxylase alpha subunit
VRVDTGIREGSEISMHYDPLICKLATHGNTRQEAIDHMIEAVRRRCVSVPCGGVATLTRGYCGASTAAA